MNMTNIKLSGNRHSVSSFLSEKEATVLADACEPKRESAKEKGLLVISTHI